MHLPDFSIVQLQVSQSWNTRYVSSLERKLQLSAYLTDNITAQLHLTAHCIVQAAITITISIMLPEILHFNLTRIPRGPYWWVNHEPWRFSCSPWSLLHPQYSSSLRRSYYPRQMRHIDDSDSVNYQQLLSSISTLNINATFYIFFSIRPSFILIRVWKKFHWEGSQWSAVFIGEMGQIFKCSPGWSGVLPSC